jgi:hypothetical protein
MHTWLQNTRLRTPRKFWVVLPLIITAFLVLLFWLWGGGTPGPSLPEQGLNLQLPVPDLSGKPSLDHLVKLRLYALASGDSLPSRKISPDKPHTPAEEISTAFPSVADDPPGADLSASSAKQPGAPAALSSLEAQLKTLQRHLGEKAAHLPPAGRKAPLPWEDVPPDWTAGPPSWAEPSGATSDAPDAELRQLNGMLDKILKIQHPESVQTPARPEETPAQASLSVFPDAAEISLLEPRPSDSPQDEGAGHTFYTVGTRPKNATAIQAAVYGTQTLVSGATVQIRLLEDLQAPGVRLRKNHLLFGTATLQGDRLQIRIERVVEKDRLIPLHLVAYDLDGIAGLHIPGALSRKSARELAETGTSSLGQLELYPSVGSRVAEAGLRAAQGWIRRKARRVTITLRDGYRMLLSGTTPH